MKFIFFWGFFKLAKTELHVFQGFFIWEVECSFFCCKLAGFFHEKKLFFFSMTPFCTVFLKIHLVNKHSTRYDFIFFFSLIDCTSIQALGRQKFWREWNERGRTLFWNCLAWRLNQFDPTSLSPTFAWALSWPSMPSRYI